MKFNKHVFLSIHKTFQLEKGKKYVNFSNLGSGPKRPDPQQSS
jgi:hypothetical protein